MKEGGQTERQSDSSQLNFYDDSYLHLLDLIFHFAQLISPHDTILLSLLYELYAEHVHRNRNHEAHSTPAHRVHVRALRNAQMSVDHFRTSQ